MARIRTPRPLEQYFELREEEMENCSRFELEFRYRDGHRAVRLRWEWQIDTPGDRIVDIEAREERRRQEVQRFKRHIERWLEDTKQQLTGEEPIPLLAPIEDGA